MITISLAQTRASSLAETALRLGALPAEIPRAIVRGLDSGAQVLIGMAKRDPERFKGKGPFPPSQNRLGRVTQNLWRGLFASAPVRGSTSGSYVLEFGSSARAKGAVNYFAIHEFGASGTAEVAAYTHPNLFGRGPAAIPAHKRRFAFPARAPMQTHLQKHAEAVLIKAIESQLELVLSDVTK